MDHFTRCSECGWLEPHTPANPTGACPQPHPTSSADLLNREYDRGGDNA